jgi:hypothetical protein
MKIVFDVRGVTSRGLQPDEFGGFSGRLRLKLQLQPRIFLPTKTILCPRHTAVLQRVQRTEFEER